MVIDWLTRKWNNFGYRDDIARLRGEIEEIKGALERARVVNFIKVIDYRPGMDMRTLQPPLPIRLEDLDRRIKELAHIITKITQDGRKDS